MTRINKKTGVQIERLKTIFNAQKQAFNQNMMPDYRLRIDLLKKLESMLLDNQKAIENAVNQDFGCHAPQLTKMLEIMPPVLRIRFARANLKKWMKPRRRHVNRMLFGLSQNSVIYQPLGVVGNISPWNFPFDISCGPLTDIIAAGNRAIIKPSEIAPACSELLAEMVGKTFEEDQVAVVTGGVPVSEAFCTLPWDHLLFTGGTEIGKKVMMAASRNLTPVTLELGGKSPTIISEDCFNEKNITLLIATKMIKSGQVCVAPDYVLVPENRIFEFVDIARTAMQKLYPTMNDNPDSTSIISVQHYRRLIGYIKNAKSNKAEIIELNPANEKTSVKIRKIPLTLILNPTDRLDVMKNEIFGPILPVLPYKHIEDAIGYINNRPRPLALYLFSRNKQTTDLILKHTISGGVSLNAVATHGLQASLPFGGVGNSGMGYHHGFDGFANFSKIRPIYKQSRINGSILLYPPYGKIIDHFLSFILRK